MDNEIFLINKYKKKNFSEVADIIADSDIKYLNYIKKFSERKNINIDKKTNIEKFLLYFKNYSQKSSTTS